MRSNAAWQTWGELNDLGLERLGFSVCGFSLVLGRGLLWPQRFVLGIVIVKLPSGIMAETSRPCLRVAALPSRVDVPRTTLVVCPYVEDWGR